MSKIRVTIDGVEKEVDLDDASEFEKDGIHVVHNSRRVTKRKCRVRNRIIAVTPIFVTALYLTMGFVWDLWHPGWLVFLLIPLVPTVLYGFGKKRTALMTITTLVVTITFFVLGFVGGWWHPGWLVFFLIPIVGTLTGKIED